VVVPDCVIWLVVGCYRPNSEASCALTCDIRNAGADCPGELACNAQGRCSLGGNACAPDSGVDDGPGPNPDGPMPDDPPGLFCFGTPPMRPCFETDPANPLTISAGFSTTMCSSGEIMELGGRPTCVVVAREVTISGAPHITGDKPLVIVGSFSIRVATGAVLDLSSSAIAPQPAHRCGRESRRSATPRRRRSVGRTARPEDRSPARVATAAWGRTAPRQGSRPRRARSRFAADARGRRGRTGNQGGPGGGAVYLISNSLLLDGAVRATGGGGLTADGAGGAGGGTGGYIGVDATTLVFGTNGRLVATGGGGAGGGCMGEGGGNGVDADTASNIVAPGGLGVGGQGVGGTGGSVVNQQANSGGETNAIGCAGGGGGGGVGTIQFFRTMQTCSNRCFPKEVLN
jgi:hypothetical protein